MCDDNRQQQKPPLPTIQTQHHTLSNDIDRTLLMMLRHSTIKRHHHGSNYGSAILLLACCVILIRTRPPTIVVRGLKHTFHIHRTTRTIIGPIGIPFGFNPKGHYRLTVSNFQLEASFSNHKKKTVAADVTNLFQNQLEAGFYLQRYDTVASFHQHYNKLVNHFHNHHVNNSTTAITTTGTSNNATSIQETCSFAHWLSDEVQANIHRDRRQRQNQATNIDDDLPLGLTNMDDAVMTTNDPGIGYDDDPSNGSTGNFDPDDLRDDDPSNDDPSNDDGLTAPTHSAPSNNNNIDKNDDEVYFRQNSYYTAAQPHGIFMSMHSIRNTWYPNQPQVDYTFQAGEAGLYFLMYQICPSPPSNMTIYSTFTLDIEHYNIDSWGHYSYLSAGEMKLPLLYLFFTMSYLLCFGIWYTNIRSIQQGHYGHFYRPISTNEPRPVLHHIHQLMSLLIILKLVSVLLESSRFYFKKVYGHADGWSVLYNVVSCINVFFFFTVLVLLGTGWSIITPFIEGRIKYMMLLVLLLQVVNNIAIFVLSQETEGESYYQSWLGLLHIVDLLCCTAVVVPIVWQISALEKKAGLVDDDVSGTLANSSTEDDSRGVSAWRERIIALESGQMDPMLEKLKVFRTFYLLVVAYIYSTRILIYLFTSILSYRFVWVEHFIIELVTLTFYVSVGILFRPAPEVALNHQLMNGVNDDDDVISLSEEERQSLTKSGGRHRSDGIELRSISIKKV